MTLGIPWDGDFYGVEASISTKDNFRIRLGVTATKQNGNTNKYTVAGAGVQVDSSILLAVLGAGYMGNASPSYQSKPAFG